MYSKFFEEHFLKLICEEGQNILEAALPHGDSKAHPPKRPFPWENSESATSKKKTSNAISKKKKLIVPDEQPIKQMLKLLK